MTISKRDAMALVSNIQGAKVGAHAIAARNGFGQDCADAAFLGGLEMVLQQFLNQHGCHEAATALKAAMNDKPTEKAMAARNAEIASIRSSLERTAT